MNKRITIYCGANSGNSLRIIKQVNELCDLLIGLEYDLVYGGGQTGLMGIVATKFLEGGREVIGVRPNKLIEDEDVHHGLTTLIKTESMHERKSKMIELGDAFIALPGGIGTLDEIIETITLFKIGFTDKPSAILNTDGYFDGLEVLFRNMVAHGFLRQEDESKIIIASSPKDLVDQLAL